MEPMSPEEEKQRGLTRERLVTAALELVNEEGLDGLSMRALADRLDVKASSLYWHVRDRRELLELLAESILGTVARPRSRATWRESVLAQSEALRQRIAAQKDAARILLEVPEAMEQSDTFGDLRRQLVSAGLQPVEASDVALMAMTYVVSGRTAAGRAPIEDVPTGAQASIAIDTGSRGVVLRAGPASMQTLIRVPPDQSGAAPAVVRGEQVVVRRLRGVGHGEIELNPGRSWTFKVQAPTWNTVLDLGGLDVRGIHVDSGASRVECFLPPPRGIVPVHVSSGVVNVAVHRATGAAVAAVAHTGAVKLRLDDYATRVVVSDLHWATEGAESAPDRYELEVSSGVVGFTLDSVAMNPAAAPAVEADVAQGAAGESARASALELLLDGVQARVGRSTAP